MSSELTVRKSVRVNATPARVWEALVNPALVKQYMFNSDVVCDWRVGSEIIFKGLAGGKEVVFVKGKITKIEPEKVLQYTCFGPDSGLPDISANYTTVTYELRAEQGQTVVTASQGDFSGVGDGEKRCQDSLKGWDYALGGLKSVVE